MKIICVKDWSISTKFVVSLLLLLILPLTVLFWVVNTNVIANLEEQQGRTAVETVKQAETSISNMVSDVNFVSLQILSDGRNQDLLKDWDADMQDTQYSYLYALDLFLSQLLDSRDYIQHVAIYAQERLVTQSGAYLPFDPYPEVAKDLNLAAVPGYWVPATYNENYFSSRDCGYEVVFLRSVNNMYRMGESLGVEKIAIDEDYICSLYQGLVSEYTEQMFLINGNGDLISSIDKSLLGQNITGWDNDPRGEQTGQGYYITDEQKLVTYCSISGTDWMLIRVERESIMQNIQVYMVTMGMSIVMTVLFGIIFWLIQRKYIIRPIKKLSRQVEAFQKEDMQWQNELTGNDEIGNLSVAFGDMVEDIQQLIDRVYKSQLATKEAQLKYLRSQINPHFLYNTLESLRWMAVTNGQQVMATQIEALAHLFYHALNGGKDMTTIGEEIAHLKDYITIQTYRFGERISVELDVDEILFDHPTLHLVLQPLVENAYVHGLENQMGQGTIYVSVSQEKNVIIYSVEDNGAGCDGQAIQRELMDEQFSGNAFALKNIYQRLQNKYGTSYGIVVESTPGQGTCVTVTIPYQGEDENHEITDR